MPLSGVSFRFSLCPDTVSAIANWLQIDCGNQRTEPKLCCRTTLFTNGASEPTAAFSATAAAGSAAGWWISAGRSLSVPAAAVSGHAIEPSVPAADFSRCTSVSAEPAATTSICPSEQLAAASEPICLSYDPAGVATRTARRFARATGQCSGANRFISRSARWQSTAAGWLPGPGISTASTTSKYCTQSGLPGICDVQTTADGCYKPVACLLSSSKTAASGEQSSAGGLKVGLLLANDTHGRQTECLNIFMSWHQ